MPAKVAIIVGSKGRGSNMLALIEASQAGDLPAEIVTVIGPSADIPSLQVARENQAPTDVADPTDETYPERLLSVLKERQAEWICLAGYLRLLPAQILQRFPNRILNIHPALLPKFGGPGMYGLRVHEAVLSSGDAETGCTIHLVNERYDEGKIIFQLRCPVLDGDTSESLAARVLKLEHQAYPAALKQLIESHGR